MFAAFAAFCVLLLIVRFVLFPRINDYRDQFVAKLSSELGQPVTIVAIETGWEGWNPLLTVRGVQIHDRDHPGLPPLVDLPRVDMVVSWASLPLLDLRLKHLAIDRPELAVRRDVNGRLHLAGIEIDPDRQDGDPRATEWLLRQPSIVVTDALLTWDDELRHAPQLVLDRVQFRLEHSFGHHRFGLVGAPPSSLASPIDFRGDVTDASLKDWRDARGRFYARLDFADVALWREWIPLPLPVDSGKGALRAWFDFAGGNPTSVVADFELVDVITRLGRELPQLELANLAGHLDWKRQAGKRALVASGLTFTTRDGVALPPTDFSLTLSEDASGGVSGGNLAIDRLDAEPLAVLAAHVPLPEGWRRMLAEFAPRGSVSKGKFTWSGTGDLPEVFAASGTLQNFGFAAKANTPGVTGLSGSFELDQAHGSANLASHNLKVDAPRVWPEPLALSSMEGSLTWDQRAGPWRVGFDNLRFTGTPLAGDANGTWTGQAKGPGHLDLRLALNAVSIPDVTRYLPLALNASLRDWLRSSLKGGTASDVRVNVAGDLAEFPFVDNRHGKFLATLKVKDTSLRFLPEWPAIDGLDAELKFEGATMAINATRGTSLGAELGPTKAEIPDLSTRFPLLTVTGDAAGPTSLFLQYIARSPVDGWIGHATEGARATGNGKLQLKLAVPLGREDGTRVSGAYQFFGNDLRFPDVPLLAKVNGRITFTEQDMAAQDVALEVLGGPAKVAISHVDGEVRVLGTGSANLTLLRQELDMPLLERVSGATDWEMSLAARGDSVRWALASSMRGAVVDLPAPIGKTAAETAPVKLERTPVAGRANEDLVTLDYRGAVRVAAHRVSTAAGTAPDRVLLQLGSISADAALPTLPGVAVRGRLQDLDLDAWLALYAKGKGSAPMPHDGRAPELNAVDLDVGKLDVFGRVLHDFSVTAKRSGEDWHMALRGREGEGEATWRGSSAALPNGRVMARLTRFVPPGPGELRPVRGERDTNGNAANPWPELDIVADTFVSKGRDLGKLELAAQPSGTDWRIGQLSLANAEGRIDANGWWRVRGDQQETLLDATVQVKDAGGYLTRFGYGDLVRGAPTTIKGELSWTGAPNDFDYATLSGNFNLQVGAGQFTKIDPGIGKLLGVLSLQALPRRITLDFHDIFSDGFAFDEINGDIRIDNGQMHTENLKLAGPAAAVALKGDVDLARETQRLAVRVQPSLSSSLSAGAAVLFIANPLVGAAVGAGALLAQKMFNNPFDQIFSYEYRVTGPWADPVVEKVNARTAAASAAADSTSEGAIK